MDNPLIIIDAVGTKRVLGQKNGGGNCVTEMINQMSSKGDNF